MLPFFIAENTHFQSPERETAAAKTRRHARNEIPDPRARLLYAAVV
jgi:hypothetical protein